VLHSFYASDRVHGFFGRKEGQGLVEYALLIALVAIALVGALTILSDPVNGIFGNIISALKSAGS